MTTYYIFIENQENCPIIIISLSSPASVSVLFAELNVESSENCTENVDS